jgi:flagellar assembly factor FliW
MTNPLAAASTEHDLSAEHAEDPGTDRETVSFPFGLPGFEDCRGFVVIAADQAPFQWLSSIDGPSATFLTVDPRRIMPTFRYVLGPQDLDRLGATAASPLLWLAVVRLEESGAIVANLRAPIVINPETMIGHQVMPQNCLYPLRHVIVPGAEG